MQKFTTFAEAVAARADADTLAHYVADTVSALSLIHISEPTRPY